MSTHPAITARCVELLDAQILDTERQIRGAGGKEARRHFQRRLRDLKVRRKKLAEAVAS